jgi:DNA-binding response OmpR family regulator
MPRILIVEDERHTADTIALYLEEQGFECLKAYDGQMGISYLLQNMVDVVVLDWLLPGLSGIEVCQVAKSLGKIKVIMLSARASVGDKVMGLDAGADDYLSKPFSLRELGARIRMLLKTNDSMGAAFAQPVVSELKTRVGDGVLTLNKDDLVARFNDVDLELTLSQFRILYLLAERAGQVLTKEEIARQLYGSEAIGDLHTITVHLSNLRIKLRASTKSSMIKTVYGIGYKLDCAVSLKSRRS